MRGAFALMIFPRLYHSMNAMLKKSLHGCGDMAIQCSLECVPPDKI